MNRIRTLAVLAIFTGLLLSGKDALAQFSITITVDENGNGKFVNSSGFMSPLPSGMLADPGPGGLSSALTYSLLSPPGLTAGDFIMLDPGTFSVSDIIRFNPQETAPDGSLGALVFYSDNSDGVDAKADTGFPSALYTNNLTVIEVGPEQGPNGASYTPTSGQPGFISGAAGPVTYVIQSDSVPTPEPSTLLLGAGMAMTLAGGAFIRRFRRA
jgi:hypothetical protein